MSQGRVLHVDIETRSAIDLRKAGAHRYAQDPTTSIVCGSYRFDDGPIASWRGTEIPYEVVEHLALGGKMIGHNQQFERVVMSEWLGQPIDPRQQDCTMSRGLALGLPASLEQMGAALGAKIQKDKEGHRLMMTMCKPRALNENGTPTWWEDDDKIVRLGAYCDQDVAAECAIDGLLPPLSDRERRVWELDQRINDRGVAVDVPMVRKALAVVTAASKNADKDMWRLTNGAVNRCTETAKIVSWIAAQGVPCESVAKGEVDDLIVGADLFDKPVVAEVVRLRRATARSSTAKYQAMLNTVCRDGRVRGSLAYHKAHTGRWAGSGMQPQNFPRVDDQGAVEAALALLGSDMPVIELVDTINFLVGPTIEVLSKCLRAMIVADPGNKLLGGDFSNIEGRINAWLAGEAWKLQAFRDYDAGVGPDLYRVMAALTLEKPVEEVTAIDRQIYGKVPELLLGFQGALGAFQKGARVQSPPLIVADSLALRIVGAWREKNSNIVQMWWDLQDAAIEAVGAPGCVVTCGKIRYVVSNSFLFCMLPSSRVIAYATPRLVWSDHELDNGDVITRRAVEYMGVDSFTKQWSPQKLYGGSQCNHVVQGTARDRMVEAMFKVEDANLPIVLTVHDELLSEIPQDRGDAALYAKLMSEQPAWAAGLPEAVKTWEDVRYVK